MLVEQGFVSPLNEKIYHKPWKVKTVKEVEAELEKFESEESL